MEKQLNILIKKAQGDRTQNAFAMNCGINSASITRILTGENTPKPDILKKIASHAHNNVTYAQLMIAAGFIDKADLQELEGYYFVPEDQCGTPISAIDGLDQLDPDDVDLLRNIVKNMIKNKNKK